MTQVIQDVNRGSLKIQNLPDRVCINGWRELIQAIPEFISVEVPSSITGIITGNTAPGEDDTNKLWLRRDAAGNFIGLYVFQGGSWEQVYDVIQDNGNREIRWVSGVSSNPPDGWIVVVQGDPTIPEPVVLALTARYVPSGAPGVFNYYAVRYVGF